MARSFSLDERALILASEQRATHALELLSNAGFRCAVTHDVDHLSSWLGEGAAMAIVDECSLPAGGGALQAFISSGQPHWSDLPVLLMGAPSSTGSWSDLGNLFLLPHPCLDLQLLDRVKIALRARQRQYQSRDKLNEAAKALQAQVELTRQHEQALHQTRKMEAIGQLAGGVAHDFNNLLTSIGGSLELVGRRLQRGQYEGLDSVLGMGQQAVGRAARLTHRLLAFSSRQSLESQPIHVATLLESLQLPDCAQAQIDFSRSIPDDLWWAQADAAQLRESLDNLLLNACEAMPSGGRLRLQASNEHFAQAQFAGALAAGDYLCLSISDNGQGMAPGTLEHAFEPFFSTKPTGQGIGLGLSMVYGFSKQSHGHVSLISRIGQGTQVALYLPRYIADAQVNLEPACAANAPPDGGTEVLIVEDDQQVRELLNQTLNEEGLTCSCAANALEALALLRTPQRFSLLISDVGLPGMSGRQLAQIARTLRPDLQVLFITGYAETAMSREGFLDKGMQLLCKPFELSTLRERVSAILQRG